MANIHQTLEPVVLEGFQCVTKPGKFGYCLEAILDEGMIETLEQDRAETLKWAESKLKNPKRSVLKPQPWEELSEGRFKIKFTWKEDSRPPIVDTEGTPITDDNTPIYSGSKVRLAFKQKPYILKDGITYGTSCKLVGIQVVELKTGAGVDSGDLDAVEVAALFGKTKGYKVSEPNFTPSPVEEDIEDDF